MSRKIKRFLRNPLYLLATVVSVAVLAVGSVIAFNALAANGGLNDNYNIFNLSYLYYGGATEDVYARVYYQDTQSVSEAWKVASISKTSATSSTTYFSTDGSTSFVPSSSAYPGLSITANAPGSSSPGWNKTVWIYKKWRKRPYYYCQCLGSTTVGNLIASGNFSSSLYSGSKCTIYSNASTLGDLVTDTTDADPDADTDIYSGQTDVGYFYTISEDKPYYFTGTHYATTASNYPSGLYDASSCLTNIELFYAADPNFEYTAQYNKDVYVQYREYMLKKSTVADFAFASNVRIPVPKNTSTSNPKIEIWSHDKQTLLYTSTRDFYSGVSEKYNYLEYLNSDGNGKDSFVLEEWRYNYQAHEIGSSSVSLPVSITVKYDYSRYKSSDGSNIKDPGDLDGTSTTYQSALSDAASGLALSYLGSFTFADDAASPLFHPQDSDSSVWCETEFWRNKDGVTTRFEKGNAVQIASLFGDKRGDAMKADFTFNNSTGYWECEVLIEPIFENCYLTLQYYDGVYESGRYLQYDVSDMEIYPYVYKDDSGGLLSTPAQPSVKLKSTSNISWIYASDDYDGKFLPNHIGEKLFGWNTQGDNRGTSYDVNDTLTMEGNTNLYAQWDAIVYHIIYDYNSPTGRDDDITVLSYGVDITESFPQKITFSKDESEDDPSDLGIWSSWIVPSSFYPVTYYSYYSSISLDLNSTEKIPEGANVYFQYWSLTNYPDINSNVNVEDLYFQDPRHPALDDFTEADDGDYYLTVYAIWNQPTYKLVYNENKQSDADTVSNMPDPSEITLTLAELQKGYQLSSTTPTYSSASGQNFSFSGWSLSDNDGDSSRISVVNYIDGLNDGDTIPVYARWIDARSVIYYANVPEDAKVKATGEVPVDDKKYSSTDKAKVLGNTGENALVRTGYVFSGWNTNADGTGTSYAAGDEISMENNVELYAQWTPLQYKLNYNANEKLTPVENMPTTPEQFTIESDNVTEQYGEYIYKFNPDDTPKAFGYEFKGWGKTSVAEVNEDMGVNESVTTLELSAFKEDTGTSTYEATVYAIWNPVKYTLNYNANKKTGMGTVTYIDNSEVPEPKTITVQNFSKNDDGDLVYNCTESLTTEGFQFMGWNIDQSATSSNNSVKLSDFSADNNDCTVYAVWQENTYKLVYKPGEDHENAIIPPDEEELLYTAIKDGHALSSDIPSDTGYTFAGWEVDESANTLNAGGTVPFASFNNVVRTVTATATWTINSYNVIYCEYDGTQINTQSYEYMSDVTVGENAGDPRSFDDKKWTGDWEIFDSPGTDGSGQTIGGKDSIFKMPANDVKFRAVYKNNTYTVRYTAGYSDSNQPDVIVEDIVYGTSHTIQDNTFIRDGYDFNGWELVEPTDKGYPANPAKDDTIAVTSDVTYRATWKIKQFTVTYQDGYSADTANDKSFTVDYGTSHTVQGYTLFNRVGYQLTGWELILPASGYSVTPNDNYPVVENVTYKAVWTAIKYWVRYEITVPNDIQYTKPEDEEIAFGTEVDVADKPTGFNTNKYTFNGWNCIQVDISSGSFTMPAENVVITGSFSENGKVTLTYNSNGATSGTAPDSVSDYTEVTEKIKGQGDLLKTGYKFDGWSENADGTGTIYTVDTNHTFTQNTTIYAKWTPNEYHVRYYDIDGNEITSLAETYTYDTDFTVRSNADIPNVTGKRIVGWKFKSGEQTDANGATITGSGTYKMPAGDVEFQAEYEALTYTVSYQVSNAPSAYTVPETRSYEYNETVTVAEVPNIEGYDFNGWNCAQVNISGGSFTMPAGNVIITGSFSEKSKVTLTYDPNGATSGVAPSSVSDYTSVTETIRQGTLAKTGYSFSGWSENSDGTGTIYAVGSTQTFNQDTTIYAVWVKNSFNVEYYEADGITLITTHKYDFEASVSVGSGVKPSVGDGEICAGWVLINNAQQDANGVDIGTRNNYPMPAETVKYKAVLEPKTYTVTYIMEGDRPDDLSSNLLPDVATYNYGDTVNVAAVPSSGYDTSEYTFKGWEYNGSGVYYEGGTSNDSFNIVENVVLKGVWTKNSTQPDPDKVITIIYTSGVTGADVTDPSLNNTRSEQITLGSDYTVHENDGWTNYVRPGYRFVNWKVVAPNVTGFSLLNEIYARFSGPAVLGQTFVGGDTVTELNDNLTLEAQWEAEKYTVTYNSNGATSGTAPTDDNDYSYQGIAVVKDKGDLVKDGAEFLNWNTEPNGNGIAYASNAQITMVEDVTLYAIWGAEPSDSEDVYYTLKYDANGATSGSVPQDYTHYLGGEKITVAGKGNLSKTNCTFKEWNTQADGKGTGYKENTDVLTMPDRDVTLYAIWVDSEGKIVSPGTGECDLGIQIAFSAIIISMLAAGCVAMERRRKHRYN